MFQGEQGESADPDVSAASATNHGFNFGSGLSTKGIGTVDETRGGGGKPIYSILSHFHIYIFRNDFLILIFNKLFLHKRLVKLTV